jgi:DNA-binding transcriptional LysR family regulator
VDRLAASAGVTLNVVMAAQDVHARVQAVVNGFGIAPVPMSALSPLLLTTVSGEAARFTVLNVKGFPIRLQRQIVYRREALPHAAQEFKEYVQRHRAEIETVGMVS